MNTATRFVSSLMPLSLLMACGSPEVLAEEQDTADQKSAAAQTAQTSASSSASSSDGEGTSVSTSTKVGTGNSSSASSSTSTSNGALETVEETGDYEFRYSWPSAAGRQPALAKIMQTRLEKARAEVKSLSARSRAEAAANDVSFYPHSLDVKWEKVADLPEMLSLSASIATYSGGAHGNVVYDNLVWDKKNEQVLDAKDVFFPADDFEAALKPRFCAALNKQRAKRRGAPVGAGGEGSFEDCPSLKQLTVILGSSNGKTFDRIGLLAAPYVAGPYVEGTYEVTLPVDAAMLKTVAPAYRKHFSAGR